MFFFARQQKREHQHTTARRQGGREILQTPLKGYSGVSLIHGLTHRETVLDSLSRDQVSRWLIYGVLSTSETTA